MHSDLTTRVHDRKWSLQAISCLVFIFLCLSGTIFLTSGCLKIAPQNHAVRLEKNGDGSYDVTDISGHKLHFAQPPRRVIALTTSSSETILDLLPPERIAAVGIYAADPGISCVVDKAKLIPNKVRSRDSERLLTLQPDLVLAPAWIGDEVIAGMREMRLPVFVYNEPVTLEEIEANILLVAAMVQEEEKGQVIVANMRSRLQAVQAAVAKVPEQKRARLVAMSYMGAFGSPGTTFYDMCRYVNVFNCVGEAGISSRENVSKEMIITMNPDVLLIPSWNFGEVHNAEKYKAGIMEDPAYREIKAVRENRVYQVEDKFIYSTSHYVTNGVEAMAAAIYPEYYSKDKTHAGTN